MFDSPQSEYSIEEDRRDQRFTSGDAIEPEFVTIQLSEIPFRAKAFKSKNSEIIAGDSTNEELENLSTQSIDETYSTKATGQSGKKRRKRHSQASESKEDNAKESDLKNTGSNKASQDRLQTNKKRKPTTPVNDENKRLSTLTQKIESFWKGEHTGNFPHIFKIITFERTEKSSLTHQIEISDLSLKTLPINDESPGQSVKKLKA